MANVNLCLTIILVALCVGYGSCAYKICAATEFTNECEALERGDTRVFCVYVTSNVECAIKLERGEADFGVFTEEEALLIAQKQPNLHSVLASFRHNEKINDSYAFESVAVVRASHQNGLQGLQRTGFCHPGFDNYELRWSPRVLKYFERKLVQRTQAMCDTPHATPASVDAASLKNFFSSACRPGKWSHDDAEDQILKKRFPELCSLCNNNAQCSYNYTNELTGNTNPHAEALHCLRRGSGNVTYVAWQHTREFFATVADLTNYGLLCENGTVIPLTQSLLTSSQAPCSWVRQPWSALVSTKEVSANLFSEVKTWVLNNTGRTDRLTTWQEALSRIIMKEPSTRIVYPLELKTPTEYVTSARPIPTDTSCTKVQRWCTTSEDEQVKCEWIRASAYSLGVEPSFTCERTDNGVIGCLSSIQSIRSDFFMSDSNYGYLARKHYKLTAALYVETRRRDSSRVIALLKDSSVAKITRFENLKDKTACFPEYGGIAWVSFVNTARERGVIATKECDYSTAVSNFFSSVCAPGATSADHTLLGSANVTTLCSACRASITWSSNAYNTTSLLDGGVTLNDTCAANSNNYYFGTNGSVACIAAPHTDVAFVEAQYLTTDSFARTGVNATSFRVLCRNNSLAQYPGYDVDDDCLMSFTVDGEILTRRDFEGSMGLRSLLWELEDLFGYTSSLQLVGLRMYSTFNNKADLLFKDSTTGLANATSTNTLIQNYVQIFSHLDECSFAVKVIPSLLSMILLTLTVFFVLN